MNNYLQEQKENINIFLKKLFKEENHSIEYLNIKLYNYFNAALKEIEYGIYQKLKDREYKDELISEIENNIDQAFSSIDVSTINNQQDKNNINLDELVESLKELYYKCIDLEIERKQKNNNYGISNRLNEKNKYNTQINSIVKEKNSTIKQIKSIIKEINDEKLYEIDKALNNGDLKNTKKEIKLKLDKYKKEKKEWELKEQKNILYEEAIKYKEDFIRKITYILYEYDHDLIGNIESDFDDKKANINKNKTIVRELDDRFNDIEKIIIMHTNGTKIELTNLELKNILSSQSKAVLIDILNKLYNK